MLKPRLQLKDDLIVKYRGHKEGEYWEEGNEREGESSILKICIMEIEN